MSTEVSSTAKADAQAVVEKYSKWSFGVGLIPLPTVDLVALTGVQVKMVSEIAVIYGDSFSDHRIKSVVAPLVGAAIPSTVARGGASSLVKSIPIWGTIVGLTTMPLVSAAATYAVGATFINHFESGGTLLNVDMSALKKDVAKNAEEKQSEESVDEAA